MSENKKVSSVADFKNQMENKPQPEHPETTKQKVKKNVVLAYPSDSAGCGHIRTIFPFMFLNSVYARGGQLIPMVSPVFIFQQDILARTRTIYFQRQMSPQHLKIVNQYKEMQPHFKYKMVWEIDDFIWGKNELQGGSKDDGVPSYNFGWEGISTDIKTSSVEIMKKMDLITTSTQFLADYINNELGVDVPTVVVPNSIPAFFWGTEKKEDIAKDLEKPKVIYTGSPTHYSNKDELEGDFDNAWLNWVVENVKNDKIDFVCMGGLPYFFKCIKDKITVIDWVTSFDYHNTVKKQKADIAIMPLVPNNFNRGKSDIKFIEHCADGVPAIGTTFSDGTISPYDDCMVSLPNDCTKDDINKAFWDLCKKEKYNEVRKAQHEYIEEQGRYLESSKYINHIANTLCS